MVKKIFYFTTSPILVDVKFNSLILCIALFFISSFSYSQDSLSSSKKKSSYINPEHTSENYMNIKYGWFIGADIGPTLFYGDVALYNNLPKRGDYSKSTGRGFSIYGGKKFKLGLSAELQLFKGTLKGEKQSGKLYRRYFNADLMGYSVSAKYNLSQLLFRDKNDRKFFNRMTVYLTVGVGQTFFRSRLYKLAVNNQWYLERVNGFSTSGIDSAGISQAGGLVQDKQKSISAIILPVGGKLNFKLNQKTNIILDVNYVTAFTDQIDSWSRSWSHKDRYLYTGVGLMYNFGMALEEDIPNRDKLFRLKTKSSKSAGISDGYEKSNSSKRTGLFRNRGKNDDKEKDKDLEIKLKLYELQLKLFEMQYLVE